MEFTCGLLLHEKCMVHLVGLLSNENSEGCLVALIMQGVNKVLFVVYVQVMWFSAEEMHSNASACSRATSFIEEMKGNGHGQMLCLYVMLLGIFVI